MKCAECGNATESSCPRVECGSALCLAQYGSTCLADHNKRHHGPPREPANPIYRKMAAELVEVKHHHAIERSRLIHDAAQAAAEAKNAVARHAALVKFLDAAYPDVARHAREDGLA